MNRRPLHLLLVSGLLLIGAGIVLFSSTPALAQDDVDPHGEPPTFLAEWYDAWVTSPHARFEDDAFTHWDEDGEISESCATCHSTPGYLDFVGADGTEAGVVDAPAPLGTVVNCDACHNSVTVDMTEVTFPSGITVGNLDDSSRCMVCHQGRSSGLTVASAIEEVGLTEEPNTVSEDLGFINIHYYAAAASLYGSDVVGGFEFPGNSYAAQFEHVEGLNTCASCHDPHTLEITFETCATCHEGVETVEDIRGIRGVGSLADYDGDGDIEEGLYGEIETLNEMLLEAIQIYATEVVEVSIGYGDGYPYFFIDTDGDGEISEEEGQFGNRYASFTPLLLQATYNYQVSSKDHAGYVHNADYHIHLVYDSIAALNEQISEPIDLTDARRDSYGHFEYASEAFRHWDEDGEVSSRCSKCHTSEGLPFFLEHGVTISFEPSNSLSCTTCHDDLEEYTLIPVESVTFPSGAELSFGEDSPNNMCLECHQGRNSGVNVASLIERSGAGDDEVSDQLRFQNPHYFATGASLFGSLAGPAYEFDSMEYEDTFKHTRRFDECSDCHNTHTAQIAFQECTDCHENVETPADVQLIRAEGEDEDGDPLEAVDYDGDGDAEEPIKGELDTMREMLLAEIFTYAAEVADAPIAKGGGYPYWFNDLNGDGVIDGEEGERSNGYASWTPRLLRAVYNYQVLTYDPGVYSHNPDYALQVFYDTLADIGGEEAVAGMTRAEVRLNEED